MTKIEWCEATWNPVTGCSPAGEGCKNCYARTMAKRLKAMGQPKYRNGFKVTCHPDELNSPILRKRKPQRIFVCSMGDLFHKSVPFDFWAKVWAKMRTVGFRHTFIVLTKRPLRMRTWVQRWKDVYGEVEPNVWLGVSVSTQREADDWIPVLRQCPAAKRIVSYEPAMEYIHWYSLIAGLDWLICGCESGPKRRHFDISWPREASAACQEAGVPFFYKQGRGLKNEVVKMPLLDGRRWEEYPCHSQ